MNIGLLIANADVASVAGATFERKNPVNGATASKASAGNAKDVDLAVQAAAAAFETWSAGLPTCLQCGAWLGIGYEYTVLHAALERLPIPS